MQYVLSFQSLFINNSFCFISPFRFQPWRVSVRLVRLCSPYGWEQNTSTAHFTLNLVPWESAALCHCPPLCKAPTHAHPRDTCVPHTLSPSAPLPAAMKLPPSAHVPCCFACIIPFLCVAVNSINRLAFVMESRCVNFEVWTAGVFAIGLAVRLRKGPWNRFLLPSTPVCPSQYHSTNTWYPSSF